LFEREIAIHAPIVLIAEGLAEGKVVLPRGAREQDAQWRVIADPIDGTRCLMYQKRSGWILTGVAPNLGDSTTLADIELAVQTEIPLVKQHLSDTLWARRGEGSMAERHNRITGSAARSYCGIQLGRHRRWVLLDRTLLLGRAGHSSRNRR